MHEKRDEWVSSSFAISASSCAHVISISQWHSGRRVSEAISSLQSVAMELAIRPRNSSSYALKLYPISLERSALLAQITYQEDYARESVRIAWEEERERIEDEFRKGQEKIRDRLLEGIEERRRKAREEKDGEGILGWIKIFCILGFLQLCV